MDDLIIVKNKEITDFLLDDLLIFDNKIFKDYNDYKFPNNYFKDLYKDSKDGLFIIIKNNNIIGYVNCIFISDETKENYLKNRDYLKLKNIGFNKGLNNMYFYTIAIDKEYQDTFIIKYLMKEFSKWLKNMELNGKYISSCISDAITQDGINSLKKMEMVPFDVDNNNLGIYYSKDNLKNYINKMIKQD